MILKKLKFFFSVIALLPVLLFLITASCVNHDTGKQCASSSPVSYSNQIKPIITSNCAIQGTDDVCHNGDNGASLDWRELSNLQAHRDEIKRRIQLPVSDPDHMPREGSITNEQIQLIICWVEQGTPDN